MRYGATPQADARSEDAEFVQRQAQATATIAGSKRSRATDADDQYSSGRGGFPPHGELTVMLDFQPALAQA